jgi:pimeloyl-ACP methyl ester carboxylesterase
VDEGEVFVRAAPAPGDAEPALFVHGLDGSSRNWTDLMGLLSGPRPADPNVPGSAGLACEALDLPGFGQSPLSARADYSLRAQAAAVTALISKRGCWPVHLIGNSLGGAVCTRVAARRPDLVRTLTLISPALPDLRPRVLPLRMVALCAPGLGRLVLERVRKLPAEFRTDQMIKEIYADPSLMLPGRRREEIAELIRRDGLGYADEVLLAAARSLVGEYFRPGPGSLWRDAARVTAPTLVIHGSHDRLVNPVMAARAARVFRSARVIVLPRTGHVAMMERPGLVAREMRAFLAAVAATNAVSQASPRDRVAS